MRKYFHIIVFLLLSSFSIAQELKAEVIVNADRMTDVNPQIFKNLQTKVYDFMNNTVWTNEKFTANEKIDCSFFINVSEYDVNSNTVTATLQVQSSRPIFKSTYSSPVLNLNDKDFKFRFLEFEQLIYDQNSFSSNLVSVLAFYANVIIGLDKDTYSNLGGSAYLSVASNIMNLAQTSGYGGWTQNEGSNTNRYFLISDLLSNTFQSYRESLFQYHFLGLDVMFEDLIKGKEEVSNSVITLSSIQNVRPNAFLMRVFFDAKADEIVSIFTGGPSVNTKQLTATLNRISPLNSVKWNNIR